MAETCPVCKSAAEIIKGNDYGRDNMIKCAQCGTYILKGVPLSGFNIFDNYNDNERALLSHCIRHSQINNEDPIWNKERIKFVKENRQLPKPDQQFNYLVQWIGDKSGYFGDWVDVKNGPIVAFTGCKKAEAVCALLDELQSAGFLECHHSFESEDLTAGKVRLLLKGWQKYEELSRASELSNNAFMAMKFKEPELEDFFENHLRLAVSQTGYSLFKLDDRPEAGLIDIRMRQEIKNSKFVIADLTHANAGAYWEAGFAEGIGKQVIYTCEKSVFEDKDKKPHFDVNHHLTIIWDKNAMAEAAKQMKAAIRCTFPEAKQNDE